MTGGKELLAPLVGDAPTVTVIGLCKNAGKTTVLCRLLEELGEEPLALTSVGRDGEGTDLATATPKPRIWVRRGTLLATARGMLPLCDTTLSVERVTGITTPLGQVAVVRALSDGFVQLAGPSSAAQLPAVAGLLRELGARRVLIDGAAGRRSLAGADGAGRVLLCAGASMEGGMGEIAAETAHVCALFAAPEPERPGLRAALAEAEAPFALFTETGAHLPLETDGQGFPLWGTLPQRDGVLWVRGGVTTPMARTLARRGCALTIAAPDATHFLMDRASAGAFTRCGGRLLVLRRLAIAAVCANPWSAYGRHLNGGEFLAALRNAVTIPVVDIKEAWI